MVSKEYIREKVQEKRELRGLARKIVDKVIAQYLQRAHLDTASLNERQAKEIVKEVRAQLRIAAGRFQRDAPLTLRANLLAARRYDDLLKTHISALDRMEDYPKFRSLLACHAVCSILDLGCGLNPLALAHRGMTYYAVDIREDELELIASFFKQEGIKGMTFVCDLRTDLPPVSAVDACLLMNVLDLVDKKGHKRAEEILNRVKAKYFFITFSTKTLSGKPMRHPQRGWIERLLARLGFHWERHVLTKEILYIVYVPTAA